MIQHRITTSDTLHGIALRYLGDASQWYVLARANRLRAPYISTDPHDQDGPPLATVTGVHVAAGAASCVLRVDPLLARAGIVLVLRQATMDGTDVIQRRILRDYRNDVCTVSAPFDTTMDSAIATLHYSPANTRGRVLAPGDMLAVPARGDAVDRAADESSTDRFGRDIAVHDGRVVLSDSGDLTTVGGAANLVQQLTHRVHAPLGSVLAHPTYGCDVHALIGSAATATLPTLMQAAVADALSRDQRVRAADVVDVVPGAVITIRATVEATDRTRTTIATEIA